LLVCKITGLNKISCTLPLNLSTNLLKYISSLVYPSAEDSHAGESSLRNLFLGILETWINLSTKYFKDSVSDKSGPSFPMFSMLGVPCSPSGIQYSLENGIIDFPFIFNS